MLVALLVNLIFLFFVRLYLQRIKVRLPAASAAKNTAAECTGLINKPDDKNGDTKSPPSKKPIIFLKTSVLRKYLEYKLDVPSLPYAFDLECAIDDWMLLFFFVGSDFLPHLEIREGAIDTLLKICKAELNRMGGYMTNNGNLEYERIQIILEGPVQRKDEIFRHRREGPPTSWFY